MNPQVLVVEDEVDHLTAVRLTLKLSGYDVWDALTGEDALSLLEERSPDAVVLDVRLPGIDGLDVFRQLRARERLAALPVVLCSAHADADECSVATSDPHACFLAKPYHPRELVDMLHEVMQASATEVGDAW
jgi:two-component system response regulator GlrR